VCLSHCECVPFSECFWFLACVCLSISVSLSHCVCLSRPWPQSILCKLLGLSLVYVCSLVGCSIYGNSQKCRSVGPPVGFPSPSQYSIPNSSIRILKLHSMFGYKYLVLFQSAAGWSLSEDSYARLLSANIIEYN